MQFELMRLAMVERRQTSAFVRRSLDGKPFTRENWLRVIFEQNILFVHSGNVFHYVPESPMSDDNEILIGKIGRQVTVLENESPDTGFAEVERDAWTAASVLIDPMHHSDGQKLAVEVDSSVGAPMPILESLVDHINGGDEPYVLEINAIVPTDTFWNFVRENRGQITSVTFEFVAPNMFGEADDYDKEMREMAEHEKAQKAKLTLSSKDGLDLETKKIERAADYTSKGAGSIRASTKRRRKKYDSRSKAKRVSASDDDIQLAKKEGILSRVFRNLFGQ